MLLTEGKTFLTRRWEVAVGRCTAIVKLDTNRGIPLTVKVIQDHQTPIRVQSTCSYLTLEEWRALVGEVEEAIEQIEDVGPVVVEHA